LFGSFLPFDNNRQHCTFWINKAFHGLTNELLVFTFWNVSIHSIFPVLPIFIMRKILVHTFENNILLCLGFLKYSETVFDTVVVDNSNKSAISCIVLDLPTYISIITAFSLSDSLALCSCMV